MDVVSSYRTQAYLDYFYKYGVRPTLITHRWEVEQNGAWKYHQDNEEVLKIENPSHTIFRLPRPRSQKPKNKFLSKLHTAWHLLVGNIDIELIQSYKVFKKFLFNHLNENTYDAVLAIYHPHYGLKLAYEIHQKFGLPYVLDFRDLWNNEIVTKRYWPSITQKMIDLTIRRHWRKWLKSSLYFSSTSQLWNHYLADLSRQEGIIVRNGYENLFIAEAREQKDGVFRLTYFGRIYREQNLQPIIEGINLFLARKPDAEFVVELIGIKSVVGFNGAHEFEKLIRKENLSIRPSMPKRELLAYCLEFSTMFILPNFIEDNGQFKVKLYDYVALGKPTLACPDNSSDSIAMLKEVHGGFLASTKEEVCEHIRSQYEVFKQLGYLPFRPAEEELRKYSREYQVRIQAERLKQDVA